MRIRPLTPSRDFDTIKDWITDRREHALWCADRFAFPLEKEDFCRVMADFNRNFGDQPFIAENDSKKAVGMFFYSIVPDTNEGRLSFVVVDPKERGKGIGKTMLSLAAEYAFGITKADALQLNVFSGNKAAIKCYESVGFTIRNIEHDAFSCPGFEEKLGRINMVMKNIKKIKDNE